ncbi:MAG: hypothetical protein RBU27_08515 [Bacteroidota bacterium]|jgi:hypothetical protein|nr:hypothetical protein [Bacteroidota bacterium]
MKPLFLLLLLSTVLAACSGGEETSTARDEEAVPRKYRYAAGASMSSDVITTADGTLRVRRPEGWVRTSDPKHAPSILLWLVREDYSASISFTQIRIDPALYQTLARDNISAVANVSLSLKERGAEDSVTVVQPVERFKVGGRICAAYEYRLTAAAPVIRVVVFDTGSRFMECAMYPATETLTPEENRRLFEVQQSVLASMLMEE